MPSYVENILYILIPAIVSFTTVNWVYFKVLKLAKQKDLVDNPDARKLQKEPIPVMGGIAVFFGVICALMAAICLNEEIMRLIPVTMAMCLMLYIGALDDISGLTPKSRLFIEVLMVLGLIYGAGGCINSFHGLFGIYEFSWEWGVPLTIFAGVGIINAINMVDGVNGLSSGLCIVSCSIFGIVFALSGDWVNATLAFTMASALVSFFLHNVFGRTSRMFIGDAGTMVMGTLMGWFVLSILRSDFHVEHDVNSRIALIPLTFAILSVPISDTIRVMTARIVKGGSPFKADKSHLHHKFISAGFSHSFTSLSEILMDLAVVGIWYITYKLGGSQEMQLCTTAVGALFLIGGTYVYLRWNEKFDTRTLEKIRAISKKTHFGQKHWWLALEYWLDAPEFDEQGTKKHKERIQSKSDNSKLANKT